jgi:hypothetical protein
MNVLQRVHLIAPCGMDCAVCSAYRAYTHQIPRQRGTISYCAGCRVRRKRCVYLKGRCARLAAADVEYRFECPTYPCDRLQHLDRRYRTRYGISLIGNLELVRTRGAPEFARRQEAVFACTRGGGLRSVHNQKCFTCDKILAWNR